MYSCVFIVAIIFFQLCHFDEGITRSIKKIGIIGGGPAGLALAGGLVANLPKSWDGEIILLESRSDILQTGLGGGVQLSGGCKTLESLGLYSEFKRIAEPLTSILARNSRNDVLFELSTRDCLAKHANELLDSDGNPIVYSIMRDSLQSLLYRRLVDDKRVSVLVDSDCKVITEKDNRVGLRLANGTEVNDLDFVFCADGTGSAGPVHVANSWRSWLNPLEALAQGAQQMLNTRYSGLRIVYCVTGEDPTFALRPEPGSRGSFHQFLGDGCYALLASYGGGKGETRGGPSHMLAVIDSGSDNDDTGLNDKENVRWRSQNLRANVAARLRASGLDKLPSLTRILDACEESRFVELKLRDRILPLLHWGSASGRVILVGDSAHSMPPFLGQGANQALQDALFLAHGIADIERNDVTNASPSQLVTAYENKRRSFTALLGIKSTVLGRIETFSGPLGTTFRDSFFRIMGAVGVVDHSFADAATPRL